MPNTGKLRCTAIATTLGSGDVTPVERWHLLGPMTAMNGVLLFGWSTAVVFEGAADDACGGRRGREVRLG
jgi:hypothetical protein